MPFACAGCARSESSFPLSRSVQGFFASVSRSDRESTGMLRTASSVSGVFCQVLSSSSFLRSSSSSSLERDAAKAASFSLCCSSIRSVRPFSGSRSTVLVCVLSRRYLRISFSKYPVWISFFSSSRRPLISRFVQTEDSS